MLEVADLLNWKYQSDTPNLWRRRYEDLIERKLLELTQTQEDELSIAASLSFLDEPKRRKFLRSPQVAARVLLRSKGDLFDGAAVAEYLIAELAVNNVIDELDSPVWTANGDRKLEPYGQNHWQVERPLALSDVVLDLDSPVEFSCPAVGEVCRLDENEKLAVSDKIEAAVLALANQNTTTFKLWGSCVDIIAARKSASNSINFASSSFEGHPGLTLLTNPQSSTVDVALLTDALVHESIHSLLFTYECLEGEFVTRRDGIEKTIIVSPWSGNPLRLPAYVHACAVWYGLFWFWSETAEGSTLNKERCDELSRRASSGFYSKPVANGLQPYFDFLSPAVREFLVELEGRMTAALAA